jgi:hypothetical protein
MFFCVVQAVELSGFCHHMSHSQETRHPCSVSYVTFYLYKFDGSFSSSTNSFINWLFDSGLGFGTWNNGRQFRITAVPLVPRYYTCPYWFCFNPWKCVQGELNAF